jgi:Flp pilus assembly protein TadD
MTAPLIVERAFFAPGDLQPPRRRNGRSGVDSPLGLRPELSRRTIAARGSRLHNELVARAVLPALALVSGCIAESTPAVRDAYVGRTRCAGCHAEAAAAWSGSHHDLAMQEVGPESVLGDFDGVTLERGGVITVFRHDGDRFIVRTDGPDGGVADFEVAYTFGVTPLPRLVIRFPNGRFQMLDVAWDSRPPEEGGQRWFSLQPDVDAGSEGPFHWTRPSQRWNTHCVECHATDPRTGFDVAIVRGTALSLLADFPSGGSARALEVALSDPEPLVRLGAVQGLRAQPALAAAPLALRALGDAVAAVRFEAVRLLAPLPPPTDPDEAVIVERAIAEYERVQLDDADDSGSWVTLGDLYASRRRVGEAEAAYGTALELDPTDLGASLNLADLLRALGREEEGERVLLAAERHHPTSAALLHAIGLLRVRRGPAGEAIAWLERAAAADPDNPRWAYVHAVAVASSGDVALAVDILEEALALHPFDRDVLSGLATYARDLGRLDEARGYARRWLERAPDAPDARALVQQLGDGR